MTTKTKNSLMLDCVVVIMSLLIIGAGAGLALSFTNFVQDDCCLSEEDKRYQEISRKIYNCAVENENNYRKWCLEDGSCYYMPCLNQSDIEFLFMGD